MEHDLNITFFFKQAIILSLQQVLIEKINNEKSAIQLLMTILKVICNLRTF